MLYDLLPSKQAGAFGAILPIARLELSFFTITGALTDDSIRIPDFLLWVNESYHRRETEFKIWTILYVLYTRSLVVCFLVGWPVLPTYILGVFSTLIGRRTLRMRVIVFFPFFTRQHR